jgi:dihydroflavonol-4-reductase
MILVTGATGCIGSNLTRALVQQGQRVAILRRTSDPLDALGEIACEVEHRFGDIRDEDAVSSAMRGIQEVYHVAGIAVPLNARRNEMIAVNVTGTANVCSAARAAGVRRLVHTSSAGAVGLSRDGMAVDERFTFNAACLRNSYIDTKRDAERVVQEQIQLGLNAVIVNPTAVLAPGGSITEGWADLVGRIARGRMPALPSGGFGFCAGRDAIDAHIKAMARGRIGERYLINTRNLDIAELVQLIASAVGVRAPSLQLPLWLMRMGLAFVRVIARALPVPHDVRLLNDNGWILTRRAFFDGSKAVRELGVTQSCLTEAAREVYAWWLAHSARRATEGRLEHFDREQRS